ncbi:transglutaminase-like domain-containing protein [Paracoccaceae bacterium GXU_MW_L88]
MTISLDIKLDYTLPEPTTILLMIEAADYAGQKVVSSDIEGLDGAEPRAPASGVGLAQLVERGARLDVRYRAEVAVTRTTADLTQLAALSIRDLPEDVLPYLLPSRYCQSDQLGTLTQNKFGGFDGGEKILAIRDWIAANIAYVSGASTGTTTALDSYISRQGVCRDYAHLMIALARAADIPARMVSVYGPDVDPPDFHAVAEVYLQGGWHLVDATGMATPDEMVVVTTGRDAADIAFMTSFGVAELVEQSVGVRRS